jgi:hypothetical protein
VKLEAHVEWKVISCVDNISLQLSSLGIKRLALPTGFSVQMYCIILNSRRESLSMGNSVYIHDFIEILRFALSTRV